jgi:hypothetical protein
MSSDSQGRLRSRRDEEKVMNNSVLAVTRRRIWLLLTFNALPQEHSVPTYREFTKIMHFRCKDTSGGACGGVYLIQKIPACEDIPIERMPGLTLQDEVAPLRGIRAADASLFIQTRAQVRSHPMSYRSESTSIVVQELQRMRDRLAHFASLT